MPDYTFTFHHLTDGTPSDICYIFMIKDTISQELKIPKIAT